MGNEHLITWRSGGVGEVLNVVLYLRGRRLDIINREDGFITPLLADAENMTWFIPTHLEVSDEYSLRFEDADGGPSSDHQDSSAFTIQELVMLTSQEGHEIYEGSFVFLMILLPCVATLSFFLCVCNNMGEWNAVWFGCVIIECLNVIMLLLSWGALDSSKSCHGLMLGAVLIQVIEVLLVLTLRAKDENGSYVRVVGRICLVMDFAQAIPYSIAEAQCGSGIVMSLVVGLSLFILFLGELATINKLKTCGGTSKGAGGASFGDPRGQL
jgi:hypothetical protein